MGELESRLYRCEGVSGTHEKNYIRSFTPEQVAELVSVAEGDWKGAILLAYYTGALLGDVANMRWNAIVLKWQLVTFTPNKTKKTLTIPLHPDLESHLLKSPGIGKAFLFPSLTWKGRAARPA